MQQRPAQRMPNSLPHCEMCCAYNRVALTKHHAAVKQMAAPAHVVFCLSVKALYHSCNVYTLPYAMSWVSSFHHQLPSSLATLDGADRSWSSTTPGGSYSCCNAPSNTEDHLPSRSLCNWVILLGKGPWNQEELPHLHLSLLRYISPD